MESLMMQISLFQKTPRYIIDTCSLLSQKEGESHNRKLYKTLWANIEKLLQDGEIVILSEIEDEIKHGGDEVADWLKAGNYKTISLDKSIQSTARDVLKTAPEIIDFKGKSSADVFLIAAAKVYNLTVITEENKQSPKKIPKVCEKVGARCIGNWVKSTGGPPNA
ncbi:MAG: DUF4411 family protein [Firmicutes bacterium]|nr:DUF4411 family protein [Bacillota bacterium]